MDDRLCLLVIIGVTEHGRKELVAVEDGYRESLADWQMLLTGLRERGLPVAPKLAVADGALGFWAALNKVFPQTAQQRCWVHKDRKSTRLNSSHVAISYAVFCSKKKKF